MQHPTYCQPGKSSACEGPLSDCPRCSDLVCEMHAIDGLCLACQGDADEFGIEPAQLLAWDAATLEEVA